MNRDVKGARQGYDLNGRHSPQVTSLFAIWYSQHVDNNCFIEGNDLPPLVHQGGNYLNIDVEDQLALVG